MDSGAEGRLAGEDEGVGSASGTKSVGGGKDSKVIDGEVVSPEVLSVKV